MCRKHFSFYLGQTRKSFVIKEPFKFVQLSHMQRQTLKCQEGIGLAEASRLSQLLKTGNLDCRNYSDYQNRPGEAASC